MTLLIACASARGLDPPAPPDLLRTDSRMPFVHRIGLYDEHGGAINPADKNAPPYSPRATCGKCHEVGTIGHGRHFNAADPDAMKGRPGEPWIYTDPATGTQIPLSYRGWAGTHTPDSIGLSAWDIAKMFGRHLPGGGAVFPTEASDPPGASRWPLSGGLEIDCLLCHSADNRHDPAERAKQIERENLRWIPTVAAGLAVVRGDASKLPDDFDPSLGPNPDYPDRVPPKLEYDKSRFDADNRVLLSITRRPSPDRCYFCHTTRFIPDAENVHQDWDDDQDVHLRAGMICVDCHRNGIDHNIVRGYEEEAKEKNAPAGAAGLSCRGCHLGAATQSGNQRGGRLGAPVPRHAGLPPLHLERLSCTTCHSGPYPGAVVGRFQTSLSHALGIPTRSRKLDDPPVIAGPMFLRDGHGKITPYRQVWPGYWVLQPKTGDSHRLDPARARALLAKPIALAFSASDPSFAGTISRKQLFAGLLALDDSLKDGGRAVYFANGYEFRLDKSYSTYSPEHIYWQSGSEGDPYSWPIAHDVRPAANALGAGGCTDCHAADSPIYFGIRTDSSGVSHTMSREREDDVQLARAWAALFKWRPTFKILAFAGIGVVVLVVVAFGLRFVSTILGGAR